MNPKRMFTRAVFALLAAAGLTAPSTAADMAGLVPRDVVLYVGWSTATGEPCPLLRMARAVVHAPLVAKGMGGDAAVAQQALDLMELCARHDGAAVLLSPEADEGPTLNKLGLVIAAGADANRLEEALRTLAQSVTRSPEPPGSVTVDGVTFHQLVLPNGQKLLWSVHREHLVAAADESAARPLLARLNGQGETLGDHPEISTARSRVQPANSGGSLTVFGHFAPLLSWLSKLDAPDEGEDVSPQQVIAALGLDAFKSFYLHFDHADYGQRLSLYVHVEGTQGLARLYKQKPLADDDLRVVPKDAFWATVGNLDLADLWQEALRVIERIKPDAVPVVQAGVATAAQFLGFSLTDDLLPALGDTWAVYDAPAHGGLLITGIVAVAEVRNAEAVQGMLARLVELLTPLAATKEITLQEKELKSGPHVVHYVLIGGYPVPVAPAWGFVNNRWIFGLNPQSVAVAMKQADPRTRGESLLDQPDFKAARALLPKELTSVGYADARSSYRTWYALKHLAQTAVASLSAGTAQAYDLGAVPTLPEEIGSVRNSVWGYGVDEHGVLCRGVGSSGVGLLLGGDPTGLAGVALTTSILLPSLSRARELAKRAVCAANLRGIGQGCQIYADDHEDACPAELAELVKAGMASPKMFVCPSSGTTETEVTALLQGRPGQLSYTYIAKQNIRSDPRNVLVYEDLSNHDGEGGNVLFVDAHVEFLKPPRYQQVIRDTYQRLQREAEMPPEFRE